MQYIKCPFIAHTSPCTTHAGTVIKHLKKLHFIYLNNLFSPNQKMKFIRDNLCFFTKFHENSHKILRDSPQAN